MTIRIGMPRALLYHEYGLLWERYLTELGAEVLVSAETTRETLDYGSVLDEVCLPAKVCFGHACHLRHEVDSLFFPRVVSVAKGQYTCPKIIGMPDLLRSNADRLPPIMDVSVNLRQERYKLFETIVSVGRMLGKQPLASLHAWYVAWRTSRERKTTLLPRAGLERIALIGHPYMLYDRQVSMNIMSKLSGLGLAPITPEMVSSGDIEKASRSLDKKLFWTHSHHLAGAALTLMTSLNPVKGIIFLTSFSCGPDALVGEIISQKAHSLRIPCMILSIDEHTAEAGFITRLEAFADMLTRGPRELNKTFIKLSQI